MMKRVIITTSVLKLITCLFLLLPTNIFMLFSCCSCFRYKFSSYKFSFVLLLSFIFIIKLSKTSVAYIFKLTLLYVLFNAFILQFSNVLKKCLLLFYFYFTAVMSYYIFEVFKYNYSLNNFFYISVF